MSYSVEKLSSNRVKISFGVPTEEFDSALQKAYLKLRSRVNVPGFRKGKAPRKFIETLYGEDFFYNEAFDLVFPDVYREAVDQEALFPVDRPNISLDQIGSGKELKFTAEVYVRPDVVLGDYRGLKGVKYLPPVSEESIEARIEQDVLRVTTSQDVTDDPAESGDRVSIDYTGTMDGVLFEGGSAEGYRLVLGKGAFIPGFEDGIIGMLPGEEKEVRVQFPEDYHQESLAGKEALFQIKLNEISRDLRPELDDEFAADVSMHTTFAQYREAIVKELEEQREKQAEAKLEDSLILQAVDASDCDIPDAMIEDEMDVMVRNLRMRIAYQGLQYRDYLRYTGTSEEQVREMYRPEAALRVKTQLVLDEIRKREDVVPTQEEIDKEIAARAPKDGRDLDGYKAGLNEAQLEYYKEAATSAKVVKLLRDAAEIIVQETEEPSASVEEALAGMEEAVPPEAAEEDE